MIGRYKKQSLSLVNTCLPPIPFAYPPLAVRTRLLCVAYFPAHCTLAMRSLLSCPLHFLYLQLSGTPLSLLGIPQQSKCSLLFGPASGASSAVLCMLLSQALAPVTAQFWDRSRLPLNTEQVPCLGEYVCVSRWAYGGMAQTPVNVLTYLSPCITLDALVSHISCSC